MRAGLLHEKKIRLPLKPPTPAGERLVGLILLLTPRPPRADQFCQAPISPWTAASTGPGSMSTLMRKWETIHGATIMTCRVGDRKHQAAAEAQNGPRTENRGFHPSSRLGTWPAGWDLCAQPC